MQTGLEIGAVVAGRFRIERFIGAGSLAEVFLASDGERRCALKVFLPKIVPAYIGAMKIDAVLKDKGARHPGVVSPLGVGEDHGIKFVVLPYIDGCSARDWLDHLEDQEQAANPAVAALVLERVVSILADLPVFAVHGALKPSNILLEGLSPEDQPKANTRLFLTDFGTCHILSFSKYASLQLSAGSPYYYLAPEFISFGGKVDQRADQYSLGALAYEMLTGRLPRKGFKPVRELKPQIHDAWDDLITRLMAKRPEERFASFAELRQALRDIAGAVPAGPAYATVIAEARAEEIMVGPPAEPAKAAASDRLLEGMISSSEHLRGEEPAPEVSAEVPPAPPEPAAPEPAVAAAEIPVLEEAAEKAVQAVEEIAITPEAIPIEEPIEAAPPSAEPERLEGELEPAEAPVEVTAEAVEPEVVEAPVAEIAPEAERVEIEPEAHLDAEPVAEAAPVVEETVPEVERVEVEPEAHLEAESVAEAAPVVDEIVPEAEEIPPEPETRVETETVVEAEAVPEEAEPIAEELPVEETIEARVEEVAPPPVKEEPEIPFEEPAPPTPRPADDLGAVIEKIIAAEKEEKKPPVVEKPPQPPPAPPIAVAPPKPKPAPKPKKAKAPARGGFPGWAAAAAIVLAVGLAAFLSWQQGWIDYSSLFGGAQPTPVVQYIPLPTPIVTPETPSPTPEATPEEDKAKKIAALIDVAKVFLKDRAYVRPRRACVVTVLRQIAEVEQNHPFISETNKRMLDDLRDTAQRAMQRQRWDDAFNAARDALVIEPNSAEFQKLFNDVKKSRDLALLLEKLRGYMQQERYIAPPDACAFYVVRQIEAIQPNHPDAANARQVMIQRLLVLAQQAYNQKKWDEAISLAQGGLQLSPNNQQFISILNKAKLAKATTPPPPPPPPAPVVSPTPQPAAVVAEHCPGGMRYVPAGSVRMGSSPDDPLRKPGEKPNTPMFVAAFCIDLYEYPNAPGASPRVNVNYYTAQKLCSEQDKRLCSEREWERTCKGPGNRRFPYGDSYNPNACATQDQGGTPRGVAPSGGWSGCRSSFGVFDLSGNVREWTGSPIAPGQSAYVVRGGSASQPDWAVRCAVREAALPNTQSHTLGFRCCRDAQD